MASDEIRLDKIADQLHVTYTSYSAHINTLTTVHSCFNLVLNIFVLQSMQK